MSNQADLEKLQLEIAALRAQNEALLAGKAPPKEAKPPKQAKEAKAPSAAQIARMSAKEAKAEAQYQAHERKAAELRILNQILRARRMLAYEMARAKSFGHPMMLHIERGRKIIASDRLEIEAWAGILSDVALEVAAMVNPVKMAEVAKAVLNDRTRRELDNLSKGLRGCAEGTTGPQGGPSPLKALTKAQIDEADFGVTETGKPDSGEKYFKRYWYSAMVTLRRMLAYFFFVTGEAKLKEVKLSGILSDVWVRDTIEPGAEQAVRSELEKMIRDEDVGSEDDRQFVAAVARIQTIDKWNRAPQQDKVDVAKIIITRVAEAKAVNLGCFVELLDAKGNLVGDYSPHVNISRHIGTMGARGGSAETDYSPHRKHVANPVSFDAKVLEDFYRI